MLGIIIDPTRSEKNLQISKEMPDDEEHQNDAGKGDDHFLTNGRAIKCGEGSHETNTVSFFALAFNHVPAWEHCFERPRPPNEAIEEGMMFAFLLVILSRADEEGSPQHAIDHASDVV